MMPNGRNIGKVIYLVQLRACCRNGGVFESYLFHEILSLWEVEQVVFKGVQGIGKTPTFRPGTYLDSDKHDSKPLNYFVILEV